MHQALIGLGRPVEEAPPAKREPVVSPRSAIKPESLTCLVCGQKSKMLKRHLSAAHGLTPQQYRVEFDLRPDYPMVAPNYADQRRDLAKKIGLGTKSNREKGAAIKAASSARKGSRKQA